MTYTQRRSDLVKGVGAGAPPGEEQAETDSLKGTSQGTDSNGVERALLGYELGDNLFSSINVILGKTVENWAPSAMMKNKRVGDCLPKEQS
jgi:hypothetical protein